MKQIIPFAFVILKRKIVKKKNASNYDPVGAYAWCMRPDDRSQDNGFQF